MHKITVYEKPTCTTCRKLSKLLVEMGVDFEKVNYFITPFSKETLSALLKKANLKPSDILRKKDAIYKELKLASKKVSESELFDLMIKHPELVQRPIVEKGNKAVLARPVEKIKELFN